MKTIKLAIFTDLGECKREDINQMIANLVLDFVLGTIPVVGDIGDFFYKANSKNLEILEKYKTIIEIEEDRSDL